MATSVAYSHVTERTSRLRGTKKSCPAHKSSQSNRGQGFEHVKCNITPQPHTTIVYYWSLESLDTATMGTCSQGLEDKPFYHLSVGHDIIEFPGNWGLPCAGGLYLMLLY